MTFFFLSSGNKAKDACEQYVVYKVKTTLFYSFILFKQEKMKQFFSEHSLSEISRGFKGGKSGMNEEKKCHKTQHALMLMIQT